jgi:hypothetical protein
MSPQGRAGYSPFIGGGSPDMPRLYVGVGRYRRF